MNSEYILRSLTRIFLMDSEFGWSRPYRPAWNWQQITRCSNAGLEALLHPK